MTDNGTRVRRAPGAATVGAALLTVMFAATAFAGEINDSNEAIEKIVIQVNDEPERDPELSVGGESVTVYEGDLVTFRIALNDDQTRENFDAKAQLRDVYKRARFEFVSIRSELGHTCTDPNESDPVDTSVECEITLGEDGNAAVRITLRALDIGGDETDPNGCVITTNTANSVHPSGGDQAQVTICPAEQRPASPTPSPSVMPTTAPSAPAATEAGAGGGALPNTARDGASAVGAWLSVLLLIGSIGALAAVRIRSVARR